MGTTPWNGTYSTHVAAEIGKQLGGGEFKAMTGARNFGTIGNDLTFRIPGTMATKRINCVVIKLTPMDEYTVEFFRIRGTKVTSVSKHEGIHCDQLRGLFERETGLRTSLTAVYA